MRSSGLARRALVIGSAVVALGTAAFGLVGSQPKPTIAVAAAQDRPGREQQTKYFEAVAKKLNVSVDDLKKAFADARKDIGLPERPARLGAAGFGRFGGNLEAAAGPLKLSVETLRQQLSGQSLTELAQARGVEPRQVANALRSAAITRIDQALKDNKLTTEQANQLKQGLDQRIEQLMTRKFPPPGSRPFSKP